MATASQKRTRKSSKPASLEVREISISDLKPYENNPKVHSAKQIALLAKSIAKMGFNNPVLIDAERTVIAGHGRLEAAKFAGLEAVPTICLGHMSPAQIKAYRIADNRLAEVGSSWSVESLQLEVAAVLEFEAEFDLELTGFTMRELELQADTLSASAAEDEEEIFVPEGDAVTQLGDLWRIGGHALLCGDALAEKCYVELMGSGRASMVFTDPPYNVKIGGHVSGKGKARHREFVQASGEMSDAEFQRFLLAYCLLVAQFSKSGSLHYHCMDWRHLRHLLLAGEAAYDGLINVCVWAKTAAGMGSLYRSQHELVAVFKKGSAPHINNVELGRNGRHRSNLWTYAGMNTFSSERDEALAMHPTVKPLALVRDAILDASKRGDIVLDPFGGSGTTLIAAHEAGRSARLIELDPLYCDVIVARAERTLGLKAVLAATGETFAEVAATRGENRHG